MMLNSVIFYKNSLILNVYSRLKATEWKSLKVKKFNLEYTFKIREKSFTLDKKQYR